MNRLMIASAPLAVVVLAASAFAQCPATWVLSVDQSAPLAPNGPINAFTSYDPDGEGSRDEVLIAAGSFTTAGGQVVNNVALWEGDGWQPLGGGVNGEVRALVSYGTGFIAGGTFTMAGDVPVNNIAYWTGWEWQALDEGLNGPVNALAWHNGQVWAGGAFTASAGIPLQHVARFGGDGWTALSGGVDGEVLAMTSHDGFLVVGGTFSNAGVIASENIARWNGIVWSGFGPGVSGTVRALSKHRDDLYVGGDFTHVGALEVNHIARWDSNTWHAVGTGTNGPVTAILADDTVYVAGDFSQAGGNAADQVAQWQDDTWSRLPGGFGTGTPTINAILGFMTEVVFGGSFTTAGNNESISFARWNETNAPWIAVHPADTRLSLENTFTLECKIARGYDTTGMTTVWYHDSNEVTNGSGGAGEGGGVVGGANTLTLHIDEATPADFGWYEVEITAPCGAMMSYPGRALNRCDSIDFNGDELFPDTLDIDDFLSVFSGGPCTNDPACGDVDFNNDGLFPDTLDIDSLLSVFSGGPCI